MSLEELNKEAEGREIRFCYYAHQDQRILMVDGDPIG
jgi:hypothetical protein